MNPFTVTGETECDNMVFEASMSGYDPMADGKATYVDNNKFTFTET